jgi:hypothetical protein
MSAEVLLHDRMNHFMDQNRQKHNHNPDRQIKRVNPIPAQVEQDRAQPEIRRDAHRKAEQPKVKIALRR